LAPILYHKHVILFEITHFGFVANKEEVHSVKGGRSWLECLPSHTKLDWRQRLS